MTFDELDELIEELEPKLAFSVASGDEIELEFRELDDFILTRSIKQPMSSTDSPIRAKTRSASQPRCKCQTAKASRVPGVQSASRRLALLASRVAKDRRVQVVFCDARRVTRRPYVGRRPRVNGVLRSARHQVGRRPRRRRLGYDRRALLLRTQRRGRGILGRMARIRLARGGPFLAFESRAPRQGARVMSWSPRPRSRLEGAPRQLPEVSFLALGTPGFLLRPPFGDNYRPRTRSRSRNSTAVRLATSGETRRWRRRRCSRSASWKKRGA